MKSNKAKHDIIAMINRVASLVDAVTISSKYHTTLNEMAEESKKHAGYDWEVSKRGTKIYYRNVLIRFSTNGK